MLDGKEVEGFPGTSSTYISECGDSDTYSGTVCLADLDQLAKVEVVYETLPGWESDISNCRKFEDLPENCQKYVRFIEDYLGVKIQVCPRNSSWASSGLLIIVCFPDVFSGSVSALLGTALSSSSKSWSFVNSELRYDVVKNGMLNLKPRLWDAVPPSPTCGKGGSGCDRLCALSTTQPCGRACRSVLFFLSVAQPLCHAHWESCSVTSSDHIAGGVRNTSPYPTVSGSIPVSRDLTLLCREHYHHRGFRHPLSRTFLKKIVAECAHHTLVLLMFFTPCTVLSRRLDCSQIVAKIMPGRMLTNIRTAHGRRSGKKDDQ